MATNTKSFSPSAAIGFGWQTVKSRLIFFMSLQLLGIVVSFIFGVISGLITAQIKDSNILEIFISVFSWFIQAALTLGLLSAMLKAVDGENPKYNDLFSKFDLILVLKFIFASLLTGFAVLAGLILLIIPGIIIANRLSLTGFILIDEKGTGPIQAIKDSWKITENNVWNLIGLGIFGAGIMLLGFLVLGIGVLASASVVSIAGAYVYRKLSSKSSKTA